MLYINVLVHAKITLAISKYTFKSYGTLSFAHNNNSVGRNRVYKRLGQVRAVKITLLHKQT